MIQADGEELQYKKLDSHVDQVAVPTDRSDPFYGIWYSLHNVYEKREASVDREKIWVGFWVNFLLMEKKNDRKKKLKN